MNNPKIGVFWYYKKNLIINSLLAKEVKIIEGFSDSPESHYNIWQNIQNSYPELRIFEYEEIPRGRVLMKTEGSVYFVYSSTSLIKDMVFRKKVIESFSLPEKQTRFIVDEHYEDPSSIEWD